MKAISHFILTTFLGGVLFLAPIVVLGLILGKAYDFARRGLQPVTALIPDRFASGPTASAILAILVLALACFLGRAACANPVWRKRSWAASRPPSCRRSPPMNI